MTKQALKIVIKSIAAAGGSDVRHHLLAYALLRGRPYCALERTTRPDHKPSPSRVAKVLDVEIDVVKVWMAAPPPPAVTPEEMAEARAQADGIRAELGLVDGAA